MFVLFFSFGTDARASDFYIRLKQHSNSTIAPCGHNDDSVVVYCEGIYVPAMRHAMTASYRPNVGMRVTQRDSTFTTLLWQ